MSTAPASRRPAPAIVRRVCFGLVALALIATGARLLAARIAPTPHGAAWQISEQVSLDAARPGAKVKLALPIDSAGARLYGQRLTFTGMRLLPAKQGEEGNRRITAIARQRGPLSLEADFSVRLTNDRRSRQPPKRRLEPEDRRALLGKAPGIDPGASAVTTTLDKIEPAGPGADESQAPLVGRIHQYLRQRVRYRDGHAAMSAADVLSSGRADDLGYARAMVALCRAAHIPARVVTGFVLTEPGGDRPHYWAEVNVDDRWQAYDIADGQTGTLPPNYVAFSRGAPLIEAHDARIIDTDYSIEARDLPAAAGAHESPLSILDLSRLPLSARSKLAVLLLLPLGALLNAAVRRLVGVQTYGTFSPALIALAAVYVDWLTAVVVFAVVAVLGLFGRAMLPGLKLSRAPRLTIVFTLVALAMALAISIMAYFDLLTGAQLVLLPIVILTSLVDRIYTVADEDGPLPALGRLLWTGLTAVGCFFIVGSDTVGDWLVQYPELHLITIALVIALAAYRGPSVTDYSGLRWLAFEPGGHAAKNKARQSADTDDM